VNAESAKLLVELLRVLVSRYNEQWIKTKAMERALDASPAAKQEYERRLEQLEADPLVHLNSESIEELLETLRAELSQDRGS
jgi:hypothetical protein